MFLTDLEPFTAYISRIEKVDANIEIIKTSIGIRISQKDLESGYNEEIGKVFIASDGSVTVKRLPIELIPTANEQKEIKEAAVKEKSNIAEYTPILNSSDDVTAFIPEGLRDWQRFIYRDVSGKKILMIELRKGLDDGRKIFRHLSPIFDPETKKHDFVLDVEPPKFPLYGLNLLKDASFVYLFEGGKTTEAARRLANPKGRAEEKEQEDNPFGRWFRDHYAKVMIGWTGGAKRVDATDWSPLNQKGICVTIFEDYDEPGQKAAVAIAKQLPDARVSRIQLDDRFPNGFDVADPIPAGMEKIDIDNFFIPCGGFLTKEFVGEDGKPAHRLTDQAREEIIYVNETEQFSFRTRPTLTYSKSGLDHATAAFSHVPVSNYVLKNSGSHIDKWCYRPGGKRVLRENGVLMFNAWQDSPYKPVPGDAKPFLDHMEHLIPDEGERLQVLRWIATLLARPTTRMAYGLMFTSKQTGVGKSFLVDEILAPIIGFYNYARPNAAILEGNFNGFVGMKRLVFCDEVYGSNSYKLGQRLKSPITDDKIEINEKYEKSYTIENWSHWIIASNHSTPIKFDGSDRRFYIPKVAESKRPDGAIGDLYHWLHHEDGFGKILNWARNFQDYVKKGEEPELTVRKKEMLEDAKSEEEKIVEGLFYVLSKTGGPLVVAIGSIRTYLNSISIKSYLSTTEIREMAVRAGLYDYARENPGSQNGRVKVDKQLDYVIMNETAKTTIKWRDHLQTAAVIFDSSKNIVFVEDILEAA